MAGESMRGKTVLITGANGGIGRTAATVLAKAGARVLMTARDKERGEAALLEVKTEAGRGDGVELLLCDFARLHDVKALAETVRAGEPRLDVLVNNAGLMVSERQLTEDGHEMTFQVNHLAPFLLTSLLLPLLKKSAPSRIINVSSDAHPLGGPLDFDDLESERRFVGLFAYGRSKLCNILFTKGLHRRYASEGVSSFAVHPGMANSDFAKGGDTRGPLKLLMDVATPFKVSLKTAADTLVWLASEPGLEKRSGTYFYRRRWHPAMLFGRGEEDAERLYEASEALLSSYLD